MKNDKSQSNGMIGKITKAVIWGTVIGAVVCMIILLLISFIFVKMQSVPEAAITPVAIVIVCIGAFVGGYFSARIKKNMGMAVGAITAMLMFVILLLIGTACFGDNLGIVSLLRMAVMLISGAIGGILGVNKRKRRK